MTEPMLGSTSIHETEKERRRLYQVRSSGYIFVQHDPRYESLPGKSGSPRCCLHVINHSHTVNIKEDWSIHPNDSNSDAKILAPDYMNNDACPMKWIASPQHK